MSVTRELELLDENTRLKARVAELETQLGQKIVKAVIWNDAGHFGRSAKEWCQSYEILRDAIFENLGQFVFDDDTSEEAIFEEAIDRVGYALRNVKWCENLGVWMGTVNLADFGGEAK